MTLTTNDSKKIVNFPVVDNRVSLFMEDLEDFVFERGASLPVASIIGALEIVKIVVINTAMDE